MTIRPETQKLLDAVEQHSKRPFHFRAEIAELVELADLKSMRREFSNLIFLSKFSSHAVTILKRSGPGTDETVKLAAELKQSLGKISETLQQLLADAPGDVKDKFSSNFLSGNTASFDNLMKLLNELSRVKNYELDLERGRH